MTFNRKDHHLNSEIRPRFKLKTSLEIDEVFQRLKDFTLIDKTVKGKQILDQFYLDIPDYNGRTYWSPELRITVEKDYDEPEQTIIRVVVGPRYSVWVFFVFIYSFLGLFSMIGGLYGLSLWNLGHESPWVWCFPITALIIFSVYFIAKVGQNSARDQTLHLVSVLYHAIGFENLERIES